MSSSPRRAHHNAAPPPSPGPPPPKDASHAAYEQYFLEILPVIDAIVAHVCRTYHASADERDEFKSEAHLGLIDKDYRKLRRYRRNCSVPRFLDVVLENAFRDFRNHNWGKFRPSVPATQHGPLGELLERYTMRDRCSFDEAVQLLRTRHAVEHSDTQLWSIYVRFPFRRDRRMESDDQLEHRAGNAPAPDRILEEAEREEALARASTVLERLLRGRRPDDQRLVRLRFIEGMKMKTVARILQIENVKRLYDRCATILLELRRELQDAGVDPALLGFDSWVVRREE